ncbi:unnamed protein product [Soboliphyme baturini]|uniref:Methylated-DNA--protein-cysteine methyltransferase n=1 Tax=Soboliphyme baturini TaxID=241478 RepID=A0A183IPC0_9BILA|nr:unnamed protein product [Soboliphyme baturini]
MNLEVCSNGVHSLRFGKITTAEVRCLMCTSAVVQFEDGSSEGNASSVEEKVLQWLRAYFSGDHQQAMTAELPPICVLKRRDGFALKVLQRLLTIKFGQTASYSEMASKCGHKNSARAVGRVVSENPAVLMIPCHRVILKSGKEGHFSGGKLDALKKALLSYEKTTVFSENNSKLVDNANM